MSKTYKDKNGYLRFNNSNKLVHRWVAYQKIYKNSSLIVDTRNALWGIKSDKITLA